MNAAEKKTMQLAELAAENEYFSARPGKDSNANRDMFQAGFEHGFCTAGINKDALLEAAIQMRDALQAAWLVLDKLTILRRGKAPTEEINRKLWSTEFDDASLGAQVAMTAVAKVFR